MTTRPPLPQSYADVLSSNKFANFCLKNFFFRGTDLHRFAIKTNEHEGSLAPTTSTITTATESNNS